MRTNIFLPPTSVIDLASQKNCFEISEAISNKIEIIRNTKQGLKFFLHFPNTRRNILTLTNSDYLEIIQLDDLEGYTDVSAKFFSTCKALKKRYQHSIGHSVYKDQNDEIVMIAIFSEFGQGVLCTIVSDHNLLDPLL